MENFDPNKTPKKQILSAQIDLSKFERATDEEKRQQDVMSESTSFFKDGMRKLFKNPLAVLSIVVLAAIILTIIIAPMIVPYGYEEILSVNGKRDKGAKNLAPFTYSKAEQKYIDAGGERGVERGVADDLSCKMERHGVAVLERTAGYPLDACVELQRADGVVGVAERRLPAV